MTHKRHPPGNSIEPIIGYFHRPGLTRYDAVIGHSGDKTGHVKGEDVAKQTAFRILRVNT
jgi:hypothetical protein